MIEPGLINNGEHHTIISREVKNVGINELLIKNNDLKNESELLVRTIINIFLFNLLNGSFNQWLNLCSPAI